MKHKLVYTLDEMPTVIANMHELLGSCAVMTFTGPLGAGKTTLVQGLLKSYGVEDVVQSPTFTYVTEYYSPSGWKFYHFDLYRLQSMQQFIDAGFAEYLYEPMSYAFIEWPEIIMPLVQKRVCHVNIEYIHDDKRCLWYTSVE